MWSEKFTDKYGETKYRFYEKYKDPLTDKWRRVSVVMNKDTRPSQKEAQKRLEQKIRAKISDNTPSSLKTLTFHQAYEEWVENYKLNSDNKASTIETHVSKSKRLKEIFDQDILITKLSLSYAQKKFNTFYQHDFSTQYNRDIMMMFKAVMNYARQKYGLECNYLNDLTIKKKKRTIEDIKAKKENYLETEEVKRIVIALNEMAASQRSRDHKRFYTYIAYAVEFMALNGCRIGELLAIQTHNIDLDKQTLDIEGTIQWKADSNGGYGIKDTTKNDTSHRTIALTQRSCDILKKLMLENKKSAHWDSKYNDRSFIFTNDRGNPLYKYRFNKALQQACKDCNIDKHVTSHTLRHTCISMMAQLGVPLKSIMQRVGHSDHKTTLQIYTHATEQMDKEMMDKLEAVNII